MRAPERRVDRRSIRLWQLRAVIAVVPALVLVVVGAATLNLPGGLRIAAVAVALLAAVAYVLVMPAWRYRVHRWEITDEAVYARSGWFVQEWRIAPKSRIQTVDTMRGPIHQWLGIATVTVTTASAAGAIEIEALDRAEAEELVERLTAETQAVPGDAT